METEFLWMASKSHDAREEGLKIDSRFYCKWIRT